ncbi:hypothetical protein BJN34_20240 [Cupriavidus necator]|uniref:O-antigen ligase domain-containing protein n=1 Tax=Cupriavidus necator TaxID=106590 RepID=A0A1U9UU39_CUPNE|nr:hypothetical protein [Cupriavidus necator]AQV96208.1 hypothetical protein BJN34_20240 [Cupriavidus necator]
MLSRSAVHLGPPVRSRARRYARTTFGTVFLMVFLVAVFEGAARKWISGSLSLPLVLLRDLLALYGIYHAMRYGGFTLARPAVRMLLLWTGVVCAWGLLQIIAGDGSLPIMLVGLRFWLLYVWFGSAAALLLDMQDVEAICKATLVLMVLMAPLVVLQHYLPAGSFLNRQVDGDEDKVFMMVEDIVRTTGTFSFTLGYTTFLAIATPMALQYVIGGSGKRHWLYAPVVLGSVLVSALVSGSRAAVLLLPAMFLAAVLCMLVFGRGVVKRRVLYWAGMAVLLGAVGMTVFSDSVQGTIQRFHDAAEYEDFGARVETIFLGEGEAYTNQSLLGAGLGRGSNLASYLERGQISFMLSETETARTIEEAGLLGYVFVALKLLICVIGIWRAIGVARRTGRCFAILLWLVGTLCLMSWSLIGQLTSNVLGFLFIGFTMAVTRLERRRGRAR